MKVSVSVLKEYDNLDSVILKVNTSKADYLHIDVMDGAFVNNKKFPIDKCKKAIELSDKKTDVHLMVSTEELVKEYALLKPDILTFHVEILKNNDLINYVRKLGIKVGLAINPETSIEKLIPFLKNIDLVLFMSVHPGLGGQEFIYDVIDKIKMFNKIKPSNVITSIDGGVNDKTIEYCRDAGCDMVVSGSYVTNSYDYNESISHLT